MRCLPLTLLIACSPALQPEDLCEEVYEAVARRTFQCTDDSDRANTAYDRMVADTTCIATEPDPGTVLVLDDCALAVLGATCDDVDALGDQAAYWIDTSPTCTELLELGPRVEPLPPVEPGSCGEPLVLDLTGADYGQTAEISIALETGNEPIRTCGFASSERDIVPEIWTNKPGPVSFGLLSGQPGAESPVALRLAETDQCGDFRDSCHTPTWNDPIADLYVAAPAFEARKVVLQFERAADFQPADQTVRASQALP